MDVAASAAEAARRGHAAEAAPAADDALPFDPDESAGKVTRATSIVCTIGPASEAKPRLREVLEAGMNIMRLNLSHGDHEEQGARIRNLREIMAERRAERISGVAFGQDIAAIAMDLKGPEIRTGTIGGSDYEKAAVAAGQPFRLYTDEAMRARGSAEGVFVDHAPLAAAVGPGDAIFIDDAELELEVVSADAAAGVIECVAKNAASLGGKKGVNVPGVALAELPVVLPKDERDLRWAVEQRLDMVFASFVRSADDVREIRRVLADAGEHGESMLVISKMENEQCVGNLDEILAESDGLMVARGDLAIEVPYQTVPMLQELMVERAREFGKPAIVATQMLDSMQKAPRPTRAEANDVYCAVQQGATGVMTSGETANGRYAQKTVRTMEELCHAGEERLARRDTHFERTLESIGEMYGFFDDEEEGEGEGAAAGGEGGDEEGAEEDRRAAREFYEAVVEAYELVLDAQEGGEGKPFVVAGTLQIARDIAALSPDFTVVLPMAKGSDLEAAQLMAYKSVAPFMNVGEDDDEWGLLYDEQGEVGFGGRLAAALCESGLALPDGQRVIAVVPRDASGGGVKTVQVALMGGGGEEESGRGGGAAAEGEGAGEEVC